MLLHTGSSGSFPVPSCPSRYNPASAVNLQLHQKKPFWQDDQSNNNNVLPKYRRRDDLAVHWL